MNNELARLMEDNLHHVWSERNASRRRVALEGVYASTISLFEVGEIITGYDAINEKISSVVNGMPGDFIFSSLKPIIINNNVGRLIWGLGPKGQPPVATGMDVAIFENGRIKSLYVFLDN
ncbi:hypothetical protein HDF24_03160 [Mucilaginibacter sp. X4EP1]|uniref:hypothetical protein n=1 Tax=Mucilaginibacter sp. X4EP1 TaxID=2723092 RepID=UPI002167E1AB|nr:hypothetical protein [Mucilaginibacter sp. X4EP1]MCS3812024.1 hypothetical protein [Mucilaginibacter sp. X4EP1]